MASGSDEDVNDTDIGTALVDNTQESTTSEIATGSQRSSPDLQTPLRQRRKKQKKEDPRIEEAFTLLKNRSVSRTYEENRNPYSAYGQHVAQKLMNYSKKTQLSVEHAINNILFKADMGHYELPHATISCSSQSEFNPTVLNPNIQRTMSSSSLSYDIRSTMSSIPTIPTPMPSPSFSDTSTPTPSPLPNALVLSIRHQPSTHCQDIQGSTVQHSLSDILTPATSASLRGPIPSPSFRDPPPVYWQDVRGDFTSEKSVVEIKHPNGNPNISQFYSNYTSGDDLDDQPDQADEMDQTSNQVC